MLRKKNFLVAITLLLPVVIIAGCNIPKPTEVTVTVPARALTITIISYVNHLITITSNYGDVVTGVAAATMTSGGPSTTWQNLGDSLQARVTTSFPNNMTNLVLTPNVPYYNSATISGNKERYSNILSTTLTVEIRDKTYNDVTKSFTVEVSGSWDTTNLTIGTITVP